MEKENSRNMIAPMQTDLTLINNIKKSNDEESLLELINRHSGIYHTMVNYFLSGNQNVGDKSALAEEKSLNIINKKKRNKEIYLDDKEVYIEPSCESFIAQIKKKEVFSLFEECLREETDSRVKKIVDLRYNTDNNKVRAWRVIASEIGMSIQGCINIHNKFIQKVKTKTQNV